MTEDNTWWRFTGIAGLKRFLPDRIIQAAILNRRSWLKWYEPVCKTCHPDPEKLEELITEIETRKGVLVITQTNGRYTITIGGIVRHPNITVIEVIGALAHYLHAAEYSLMKFKKEHT